MKNFYATIVVNVENENLTREQVARYVDEQLHRDEAIRGSVVSILDTPNDDNEEGQSTWGNKGTRDNEELHDSETMPPVSKENNTQTTQG